MARLPPTATKALSRCTWGTFNDWLDANKEMVREIAQKQDKFLHHEPIGHERAKEDAVNRSHCVQWMDRRSFQHLHYALRRAGVTARQLWSTTGFTFFGRDVVNDNDASNRLGQCTLPDLFHWMKTNPEVVADVKAEYDRHARAARQQLTP